MASALQNNNGSPRAASNALDHPLPQGPNGVNSTSSSSGIGNVKSSLEKHRDAPKNNDTKKQAVGFWGTIGNFFCAIGRAIALFFCWIFCIKDKPVDPNLNKEDLDLQNGNPKRNVEKGFAFDLALREKFLEVEGVKNQLLPENQRKIVLRMLEGILKAPINREEVGVWNGGVSQWSAIAADYKELQKQGADPIHHLAFALTNGLTRLRDISAIPGRLDNYIGTRAVDGDQKYTEGTLGRVLDSVANKAQEDKEKQKLADTWPGFFQYLNLDPEQTAPDQKKTLQTLIVEKDWNSLIKDLIALRTHREGFEPKGYPYTKIAITTGNDNAATDNNGGSASLLVHNGPELLAPLAGDEETKLFDFFMADNALSRGWALGVIAGSPLQNVEPMRAWQHLLVNEQSREKLRLLVQRRDGSLTAQMNLVHEKVSPHTEAFAQEHMAEFCRTVGIDPALTQCAIRSGNWSAIICEALSKVDHSHVQSPYAALTVYASQFASALQADTSPLKPAPTLVALTPSVAWVYLLNQETFVPHLRDLEQAGKLSDFCTGLRRALNGGGAFGPTQDEREFICAEFEADSQNVVTWAELVKAILAKKAEVAAQ